MLFVVHDRLMTPMAQVPGQASAARIFRRRFMPGDPATRIETFPRRFNNRRHHERLPKSTPVDTCLGRTQPIIKQRERIRQQTSGSAHTNTASSLA